TLILIGSDRGLCGSFNTALYRHVIAKTAEPRPALILVGRKPKAFFARTRRFEVTKTYENLPFPIDWATAETMTRDLVTVFSFMQLSRIEIAYQRFVKPGISRPAIIPWLPFSPPEGGTAGGAATPNCEPSVAAVLELILPRALTAQLHRTLLESQASEQGARMVAMENAATNAEELSGDLTLLSNQLRQSGITKELLEITTGAEALRN
ncbi:MAG: FoF1 ATP synthase subunit gamma, partial [bacterium]